jgi:DNA-binding cell septation regulator SpoVG
MSKISEVDIQFIKPQNGLIAFASFVYDNSLFVSSVGVHQKLEGDYRLTFPTKLVGNKNIGICHPINQLTGSEIETAVLNKVRNILNETENKPIR